MGRDQYEDAEFHRYRQDAQISDRKQINFKISKMAEIAMLPARSYGKSVTLMIH